MDEVANIMLATDETTNQIAQSPGFQYYCNTQLKFTKMYIPIACFVSDFPVPNNLAKQFETIKDFRGAFYKYFDQFISEAEKNELNKKKGPVSPYPTLYFQPLGDGKEKTLSITAINPLSVIIMQRICTQFPGFELKRFHLKATGLVAQANFVLNHTITWKPFSTPEPIFYRITQWLPWEEETPEWHLWEQHENNLDGRTELLEQKLNLQLNNEIGKFLLQEQLPAASITDWRLPEKDRFKYTRTGEDGKILVEKFLTLVDICFELPYYRPGGVALGYHKTFGFGRISPL
jgi:hypothetical protein